MQVNSNSSIVLFEPSVAAHAPSSTAREDRRAVKKIASSIDSDLRKLSREGFLSTNVEKIAQIGARVSANQMRLNALFDKNLDRNVPPQGGLRKVRSAVALGSSMIGRSGAIAGASVVGIVEGAAVAAAIPILSTAGGIQSGVMDGAQVFGGYLFPITIPVGAAIGATTGAINGVVSGVIMAPIKVALRGSYTRNAFNILDPYSKVKAHVARKSMSTQDIASAAALQAEKALSKAEDQYQQAQFLNDAPAMMREAMTEAIAEGRN